MSTRVWFAEPLLSSATQEVQRLIVLARQWADRVAKPVRGGMSDKQDACVTAIATEFPGIPHRSCHNHFLRDVAKPVLEIDRHAKVKMRRKVRGLRAIERCVLEERRQATAPEPTPPHETSKADDVPLSELPAAAMPAPCAASDVGAVRTDGTHEATGVAAAGEPVVEDEASEVVLGYCAAVRGILNDSQGGPLHPPGVRMSEALQEVRDSLDRTLGAKKGGLPSRC